MKNILVPIDFSEKSEVAIDLAIQIAKTNNSTVHLLHVLYFPLLGEARADYNSMQAWDEVMKHSETHTKEKMDKMILSKPKNVNIVYEVKVGSVLDEILSYENEETFDLLILGANNTTDIGAHLFGTLTDRIVHQSAVPVMVVRERTNFDKIKKAIVGNAIKINNEKLHHKIEVVKSIIDAKIELVRVNTPTDFMSDDFFDDKVKKLQELSVFSDCTFTSVNFKNLGDGLLYHAAKTKANMIVISDKRTSVIRRLVLGEDLAEHVMDFSNLPVLIL